MSLTQRETADKIYFDITITNLATISKPPPELYFIETRNNPFILCPESYYMSIVRFSLDTPTLPVIQPEIQPNQTNVNLTTYSITLSWTNPVALFQTFDYQQYLIYAPQNLAVTIPSAPAFTTNKLQNNATGYYDIINYQYFIYLVNQTFLAAYNGLSAVVTASGLVLPTTYAPVMDWNVSDNTAVITADNAGYNDLAANYIKIYFNPSMYQLFSSFPVIIEGFDAGIGKNVRIVTNSLGGSNLVQYPPTAPLYTGVQIYQEFSTVSLWTPITSIVFTSNTVPVVTTQLSAPLLFFNGATFVGGGNNSNVAQVITDFIADEARYKPTLIYEPSAQYRLIELVGNTPLTTFDVSVYYKNRVGELIPFRLSSGSSATIKVLFSRKGTAGNTKP
jgi:hypothetical protein